MASYFYIPKKDKSLQLVQDYRKLNQYMIKDKTLLLLIREVIDKLKESKYFNKLNLIWDYNNIQIKEEDKWKIALLINKEIFKPKVMYFRLYNLPEIKYPYGLYPIKSRWHILHNCKRFNGYWNLRRDFLSHFVMFLEANPSGFAFIDNSFLSVMSKPHN